MAVSIKGAGEALAVSTNGRPAGACVIKSAAGLEIITGKHNVIHQHIFAVQLVADGIQLLRIGNSIVAAPLSLGDQGHGLRQICLCGHICLRRNITTGTLIPCTVRGRSSGTGIFRGSFLRHRFLGNRFLGNRFLGDGFLRDGFLRDGFLGDGFLGDGFLGDGFLRNGFLRDGFLRDRFLRDGFLRHRFLGNRHLRDGFLGDRFLRRGHLRNGFGRCGCVSFCCRGKHRYI